MNTIIILFNKKNICNFKLAYVSFIIVLTLQFLSPNIFAGSVKYEYQENKECDNLFNRLINNSNPDTIFYLSELLINLAESNWYYKYQGYYFRGKACFLTGDFGKSLDSYFISLRLAENNNFEKGIGIINNAMGIVYSSSKDYNNSISSQKKAIKSFYNIQDTTLLASSLFNLGRAYYSLEQYDSALYYLEDAINYFEYMNYTSGIAYCLGLIGNINYYLGNFKTGQKKIVESINILIELGDYYPIASYYLDLAGFEQEQKNLKKAIIYADSGYVIAKKYNYLTQQRDAANRLFSIYSESGDYKTAFKYQSEYYTLRDSIINEETIRKMADLRTEYKVSQKQAEIDVLNKTKKIQQLIGIGLGIIIILSVALIFNMYRSAKRQHRSNKKLEEQKKELQTQYETLDDLNKTKDRFFSIISHDLRGPIGVLKGTTLLIREYLQTKDYVQLAELTTNMEFSVKKVQNLLDNLLEWALNQQGKFKKVSEKLELNEIVRDVITTHHDIAVAKEITVKFICKEEEINIYSDANSLMTIIRNLLSNALKFTKRNGLITISVIKEIEAITIIVADNGIGMPKSKMERLFKIDENKSTWGTEREKGLGIGLNLVNEFIKLNEGSIQVESEQGVGTKFTVRLPIVFVNAEKMVEQ